MSSDGRFLAGAAEIGRRVVAEALWEGDRCAWVGADPVRPWEFRYAAVGPALYGGTAGIGLFLAHLAVATGEAAVRRTALGALRHATQRVAALAPDRRDGFHSGALGIAWAAAMAAAVLGAEELDVAAGAAAREAHAPSGPRRALDISEGAAGAIIGRLALDDARLLAAVADGETLLARATIDGERWSWPSRDRRHPRHLCGLAHGAAGIGSALLALFEVTGDHRFRTGAVGAFAYERAWMDPTAGTYPDHRLHGYRRGRPHPFPSPALGTWCHGEAGIALTRLRAAAVLGPQEDLSPALDATRRRVEEALRDDLGDLSLCHGLAGAGDTLLCAHDGSGAAIALADAALERHAGPGDWPVAEGPAVAPGLFPGLAGIGWFFLRLHDPDVPSPVQLP